MGIGEQLQTADWKAEKHVPVIECPDVVTTGEVFDVTAGVGKEIAHPNTTDHHIRWIALFFKPEGDKFTYELGRFEFNAHGESVEGPDTGPAYTHHKVTVGAKIDKPGEILAMSLCNIHGLWESSKTVDIER